MTRFSTISWIVSLCAVVLASPFAQAQSSLETLLKKASLNREEKATLEAEIKNKVKQLVDAPNAQALTDRRDFLLKLTRTSGMTPAGLAALADAAAEPLQIVAAGDAFDAAYAATVVLVELKHPRAVGAMVAVLASEFPAVRYMAARGLKSTMPQLQASPGEFTTALEGLAQRGTKERDPIVLRALYDAIDVHAAGINAKNGDACATALATVFRGRLDALASGSRDESKDLRGIAASTPCYEKAGEDGRVQLAAAMAGLLDHCINRYFDPDTSVEARPGLADVAAEQEKALRQFMKTSGVKEPGKTVAAVLKSQSTDLAKQETDARAALEEIRRILRGDPWKLP
ncbi:MAG: hypothetical protein HBSAPP02_25100 [Phycisphaerae bacterium]|nr:MAG: hypothetical protein HRU71_13670 [Planctomycetia bacterium]RIK69051.1 MAG: hypothetical protein DCC66_09260 [Planctomycetota bacterium]GJQ27478.1 MAG: hypothetical protein HBSAPP02_25100 [Phycisphaerae bacterium]